jgi:hypothetical protein
MTLQRVEAKLQTLAAKPTATKMKEAAKKGAMAPVLKHAGKLRRDTKKVPWDSIYKEPSKHKLANMLLNSGFERKDPTDRVLSATGPKRKSISAIHNTLHKLGYQNTKNSMAKDDYLSEYSHPTDGNISVKHNNKGVHSVIMRPRR